MTEQDVQQVLLVQAVDGRGQADGAWGAADALAASAQARQQVGEQASFSAFVLARARLAVDLLAQREHRVAQWRTALAQGRGRSPWALLGLVLAFALGALGDAGLSGGHIQLLALPLLGLLAWNALVYLGVLASAWPRRRALGPPVHAARGAAWWHPAQRLAQHVVGRALASDGPAWWREALAAQTLAWRAIDAPRQRQRALAWLHLAAACVALGLLASMYARGLVLDFRAGWDSTFLQAPQVHRLLGAVLAPAQLWPGLALPDEATLASLRWADGSPGAPAGPWIHRIALALLAWVVLPRLLLALWALWRARRAAARLALPLDGPYYGLLRSQGPQGGARAGQSVTVLPYNCHASAQRSAGLAAVLAQWPELGPGAQPQCAPVLPLGAEDQLPQGLPLAIEPQVVVLMALNATPEQETHGAFLRRLPRHLPRGAQWRLLLDSSEFDQRLAGAADAGHRRAQRLQAWQQMLDGLGAPPPRVANLAHPAVDGGPAAWPAMPAAAVPPGVPAR